MGNDFKRAKEFFREFLGGSHGMDVLGFNEDLIRYLEVRRRITMSISRNGVSVLHLGDGRSEMLVEIIKVNSKLMGMI